jgi:hypothetical protein
MNIRTFFVFIWFIGSFVISSSVICKWVNWLQTPNSKLWLPFDSKLWLPFDSAQGNIPGRILVN